jgi:hypothetical protein
MPLHITFYMAFNNEEHDYEEELQINKKSKNERMDSRIKVRTWVNNIMVHVK